MASFIPAEEKRTPSLNLFGLCYGSNPKAQTSSISPEKRFPRCGCDVMCFVKAGCVKNSEEMLSRHLLCVFTDLTGLGEENAAGYDGARRAGYCVKARVFERLGVCVCTLEKSE